MSTRKKIVLSLLSVIYLALVWVLAAVLANGVIFIAVGLVLTACGGTILGVYLLVGRIDRQRSVPQVEPAAKPSSLPDAGSEFSQPIEELLADGNERLARSPKLASARVKTTVADLPLYLAAGLENTGKTSTIRANGVGIELLSGQFGLENEVAKTAVGNLWLGDGVVLAESGGQIFATEPQWRRWLSALAGKAGSRLLNRLSSQSGQKRLRGVLLFCDSGTFLGAPDAARQSASIRLIQDRLRAVGDIFRCSFPVYVLFSKADRIPFFQDYFARLRGEEDRQPFGCTLPPFSGASSSAAYGDEQNKRVAEAFNALYLSLTEKRLVFLSREQDPVRKPGIYEFPRELRRIRGNLIQFLVEVFKPDPLQPGPMLRGFYFTGTRIVADAPAFSGGGGIHSTISASGGATVLFRPEEFQKEDPRRAASTRVVRRPITQWTFVPGLLRNVILADSQAAPVTYRNKRGEVRQKFVLAAAALLCVLFTAACLISFFNNRDVLETAQRVSAVPPRQSTSALSPPTLNRMEDLRLFLSDLEAYERHTPLRLSLLLYSGQPLLNPVQNVFFTRFREYLLEDVTQALAQTLAGLPKAETPDVPYETVYDRLKAYLAITSGECPPERPGLPQTLTAVWMERDRPNDANGNFSQGVFNQFYFYAERLDSRPALLREAAQENAKTGGRDYLNAFGNEKRVYRQIVETVNAKQHSVRLSVYAPGYEGVLQAEPVEMPGAFTREGWDQVQAAIDRSGNGSTAASCVVGDKENGSAQVLSRSGLADKLRDLYVSDYAAKWRAFLARLRVTPYRSSEDAAQKLRVLVEGESPLLGALNMARDNTAVRLPLHSTAIQKAIDGVASTPLSRFTSRFGRVNDAVSKLPHPPPPEEIILAKLFQPVHAVFDAGAAEGKLVGQNNSKYMDSLRELGKAINSLGQSKSAAIDPALNIAAASAYDEGIGTVVHMAYDFKNLDVLTNDPGDIARGVESALKSPIENSAHLFMRDPAKAQVQKTNGPLSELCRKLTPLLSHFPFRRGGDDLSLTDFVAVFAPRVGFLELFSQQISSTVIRSGGTWQQSPALPPNVQVDAEFLHTMNRLSAIGEAFFPGQEPVPQLSFQMEMVPDPNIASVRLTVDGRPLNAPPWQISWPGSLSSAGFQMMVGNGAIALPCASYDGPWALFRFLGGAKPRLIGDTDLAYPCYSQGTGGRAGPVEINGKPLLLHLKLAAQTPSARSALDPGLFNGITCPNRIVSER